MRLAFGIAILASPIILAFTVCTLAGGWRIGALLVLCLVVGAVLILWNRLKPKPAVGVRWIFPTSTAFIEKGAEFDPPREEI